MNSKQAKENAIKYVSSKYGAPMGRRNIGEPPENEKCFLFWIPLNSGGYDAGGAYWGLGQRIYCACDAAGEFMATIRADNRQAAGMYFASQWDWVQFRGVVNPAADVTPVNFRVEENGDVLAVFPYDCGDNDAGTCAVYSRIGQHSAAAWNYVYWLASATPEQYAPLKKELTHAIGYKLKVLKRLPNSGAARAVRASKLDPARLGAAA
jgi:hypothetical protein